MDYAGGCLCGALRYRVQGEPIDAAYCHCRLCQRSAGAPVLAWATFATGQFDYSRGEPAVYRSSTRGWREFCPRCGTQIAFRSSARPEQVDVTLGSLDEPLRLPPQYHIWCDSRIDWFETADALPRYADVGPDGPPGEAGT